MRLYFIRHGESEANRLKIISNRDLLHPLTEKGRMQVLVLAGRLRAMPIARIYSSPILRARQTGEILAAALSVPLELADALREPDCGILEGRGDAEAWAAHRNWMEAWLSGRDRDKGPAGGESFNAVRERFAGLINSLVEKYGERPAEFVLVTHGQAMLFGLPGLVRNLEAAYIRDHLLGHAEVLQVNYRNGRLSYSGGMDQ